MLFNLIAGCGWIDAKSHLLERATWDVAFVQAEVDCVEGLSITATALDPDIDGVELTLHVEGPNGLFGTAQATIQNASIRWTLPGTDLENGAALSLTLNSPNAVRVESLLVEVDGAPLYQDADGDTFGAGDVSTDRCSPTDLWVQDNSDCNDTDILIHPVALEDCSPIDRNCDGDPQRHASDVQLFYADVDEDGFGDPDAPTPEPGCAAPPNFVDNNADCNDHNFDQSPDALEICNGIDDDCDTLVDGDDPSVANTVYTDADMDDWGDEALPITVARCNPEVGESNLIGDCNDQDATIHPHARELCNDIDEDCDGDSTNTLMNGAQALYNDFDADGFGAGHPHSLMCVLPNPLPPGLSILRNDCDDNNASISPGLPFDVCNGFDNDCDGNAFEPGIAVNGEYHADTLITQVSGWANGSDPMLSVEVCGGQFWGGLTIPVGRTLAVTGHGPDASIGGSLEILGEVRATDITLLPSVGNTLLEDGQVVRVAAIKGNHAALRLFNVTIDALDSNGHIQPGSALYVAEGATLDLDLHSRISGFTSDHHGAAIHATGQALVTSHGTLDNNFAGLNGGAVYLLDSSLDARDGTFSENQAGRHGGGLYAEGDVPQLITPLLSHNHATENGGGAYLALTPGDLVVIQNSIVDNSAEDGGGIYINSQVTVRFDGSSFERNLANREGGGLNVNAANALQITGTSFVDNTATQGGGGLYARNVEVLFESLAGPTVFMNNTAGQAGGGIYLRTTNTDPCGLNLNAAVDFIENTADRGAAVHLHGLDSPGTCPISATQFLSFTGNTADRGAALSVNYSAAGPPITINLATFHGNTSTDTSSGDLLIEQTMLTCTRCSFSAGSTNTTWPDPLDLNGTTGMLHCSGTAPCSFTPEP